MTPFDEEEARTAESSDRATAKGPDLVLYDNPFSPFTRKVRLVLRHKGLAFRSVDALALAQLPRLAALNPRAEVPVLVHRDGARDEERDEARGETRDATHDDARDATRDAACDVIVLESADIVAYLEDRFPRPAHAAGACIEWLLARGFDDWWTAERASGRAVVPSAIGST